MAVQMNYVPDPVEFGVIGVKGKIKEVLFGEVVQGDAVRFRMGRVSLAAVILRDESEESVCQSDSNITIPMLVTQCNTCI